jgi:hypothetical protein
VQPLQGFAYGLAADAEVLGEVGFDEVLTGLERAVDDQFGQGVVDGLAQWGGPGDRAAGCHGGCVGHGPSPSFDCGRQASTAVDVDCDEHRLRDTEFSMQ